MADGGENPIMSEMMRKVLENPQEESNRRGQHPELLPPETVRYLHRQAKQQVEQQVRDFGNAPFRINTSSNTIFASKTAISKLTPTIIPELTLEESAKGKYILCRVIEEWYAIVSWNTVIEDQQGYAVRFSMYNYPQDEIFSPGDVIVIKEPYLKLAVDQMPTIRCDCPTDIFVLRRNPSLSFIADGVEWVNEVEINDPLVADPVPSDADQWKTRGNILFARGNVILSREAYNNGLEICPETDPTFKTLWLNQLSVHLRLEYFELVAENGEKFLLKFPENEKGYLRLGKAYQMLRNYEKALEIHEKFCQKFPNDQFGKKELERVQERFRESKGDFDFEKLGNLSLTKPFEEIDCADYCGPVHVVTVGVKGRGLVLTEDVVKNRVLLVSKALVSVLDPDQNKGVEIQSGKRAEKDRENAVNVAQLARLVTKNPKTIGALVYDLCSGEKSSEPAQLFCNPEFNSEPICDVQLLRNIIVCNSFQIFETKPNGEINFKGSGLFVLPSYINHSCSPNAQGEFYNNVMVLRSLCDMKKGTEVTISYIPTELGLEQRRELLKERGFKCRCSKCKRRG